MNARTLAPRRGDILETRMGRPVEIIHVAPAGQEFDNGDAIVGIVTFSDGSRDLLSWKRDGAFLEGPWDSMRLILPQVRVLQATEKLTLGSIEPKAAEGAR